MRTVAEKTGYSVVGLRDTWRSEPSFRQWFVLAALSDAAALLFAPDVIWVVLVVVLGLLLLAAELINTGLEAIVDKTTPEIDVLAKKAKDAGSAMTMVTFLGLVVVWVGMFITLSRS